MRSVPLSITCSLALAAFATSALGQAPKTAQAPKLTPAVLEAGKASFAINCAACHGALGAGDGAAAAALNPKPRSFVTDAFKNGEKVEEIYKTTSEGLTGTVMVAFAHLPENERWALSYYVLELRKAGKNKKK